jgi:hemoglobin-like flavoprotein
MLTKILLLVCAVGYAAADCNALNRIKLKSQWAQAYTEGLDREAFGQALWRTLFRRAPEARGLFDRVNGDDVTSPEFNAHAQRVLSGLDICFSLLDDVPTLKAQLSHLKDQHIERQITQQNFKDFGRALREVIPAAIGRCYDEQVWSDCFETVADGIKSL